MSEEYPEIILVRTPITRDMLKNLADERQMGFVKAVVDLEQNVMALGATMHVDEEQYLLENGSTQANLWGINFHPHETDEDFLEFNSMINIRPWQGNRSRDIVSVEIQKKIKDLVANLIPV